MDDELFIPKSKFDEIVEELRRPLERELEIDRWLKADPYATVGKLKILDRVKARVERIVQQE